MKHTLIVVDVQRDFYHPTGSLYVKGGQQVVDNIVKTIVENSKDIDQVIFTLDWHPYNADAYVEPQVNWPLHCAQNSEGAGVANELIRACYTSNVPMKFFYKGQGIPHTEYGAFENIITYAEDNGNICIQVDNRSQNNKLLIKTKKVVVCGIAGDYCVMNTIKNLKKYNGPVELDICAYMDGICSIDGTNNTIENYCKENGVNII